jgi:Na+-transporting methylmalonyl-CoA/oxaloacetate decarboxylase beta subunit
MVNGFIKQTLLVLQVKKERKVQMERKVKTVQKAKRVRPDPKFYMEMALLIPQPET